MRDATTASAAQTQESERLPAAKAVVRDYYCALAELDGAGFLPVMKDFCAPDLIWRGFHPFDLRTGPEPVAQYFWAPLARVLRPLRRRMDMFIAGTNWLDDGQSVWVASMGHLMGLFEGTWLGIRPTGKLTMLRYAAFHRVETGRIVEEAMYFDIPASDDAGRVEPVSAADRLASRAAGTGQPPCPAMGRPGRRGGAAHPGGR
jgi:Ketosteroid isomerase-related protein